MSLFWVAGTLGRSSGGMAGDMRVGTVERKRAWAWRTFRRREVPWVICVSCMTAMAGCATSPRRSEVPGLDYSHLERTTPRPLHIHVLRIDLKERRLSLQIDVSADPDGDGPAETVLATPVEHARRGAFVAGVNANAWDMVPSTPRGERPRYAVGGACDLCGWVLVDGLQRSAPQAGYWSFWLDRAGLPHVANLSAPAPDARWAIAGFGGLLQDGKVLPGPSDTRHPRTALGLDGQKRFLVLAVVDGRQPGYSEGMSERELGDLMVELGCTDAINLDGGGSSVMVVHDTSGAPRIVNRPSDLTGPRPIPVLFGVREAR